MRIREERKADKEWRCQEVWKKRRQKNRKRVMIERKYFVCGSFEHIAHNCRNMESRREEGLRPILSNKFEVLNIGEGSGREINKDRKTILREERRNC